MDPQNPNTTENEQKANQREILQNELPLHLRGKISLEAWNMLTYEQKDILLNIEKLPQQLLGVVPETVWDTLNFQQKMEFLFSHGLLQKETFDGDGLRIESEEMTEFKEQLGEGEMRAEYPESNISDGSEVESSKEFEQLKSEVREIGQEDDLTSAEAEDISPEDVDRIEAETGATFSVNPIPKFAGYQPPEDFIQEVEVQSNGSPKKATTWTANIIKKIWISLGS